MKILTESQNKKDGKVPMNNDVVLKCRCNICPVQGYSACSTSKVSEMISTRAANYCSVGYADCKDLDNTKNCICPTCQVYVDFSLAKGRPIDYFCFNGKAIV